MQQDLALDIETKLKEVTKRRKEEKEKIEVEFKNGFAILNGYFRAPEGTYRILRRNIEKRVSTLLIGATGCGKTELVDCLAKTMNLPVTIFDMGTMVDPIMGLVGTHTIKVKEGKTHSTFIRSRFSRAIQEPGVVLLDEASRASALSNNLLFPVLDFRKELSMEYSFDNSDPIKVHDQCVFIATANLGTKYTGTHRLDKALVDRFMMIEIDPLEKDQILDVVHYHYPKVSAAKRTKIVDCYVAINKEVDECKVNDNLAMSLRHLKMISALVDDGFTIYDSFYAICKGIGSKEGLKSLEVILKTVE